MGEFHHQLRQAVDGDLFVISNIEDFAPGRRNRHEPQQPLHRVGDETKTPCLLSIPEDAQGFPLPW